MLLNKVQFKLLDYVMVLFNGRKLEVYKGRDYFVSEFMADECRSFILAVIIFIK